MRGIAASVGTPPQDIVLLPWAQLNNTWIYDQQAYCDPNIIWNETICQVRRGNYYKEGNSSTFVKTDDIIGAGGASIELNTGKLMTSSLAGTDIFNLNSTITLNSFPLGIPRLLWGTDYTILHPMGMGTNSTILNALVQAGQIGSRVWSIFWGRMWVDEQHALDGSIVFGGFDQQKIAGKNYTLPLDFSDTRCWTGMKVRISRIALNFLDGYDHNLLPPSSSIDACIVPQRQLLLEAQGFILNTFEQQTGLDVTIPNSQYLVPYVDIDRDGSRIFDTSIRELLIDDIGDQLPMLGRYFLTAAYLMVDLDSNTFTLWQANPTRDSKLVPVAVNHATESQCGSETSTPAFSSLPSDSPEPPQHPQEAVGLAGGSIAGIVVGAIAALSFLALGVFFYLRRVRTRLQLTQDEARTPAMGDESRADQMSEIQPTDNTKQQHVPLHEVRGSHAVLPEASGHDHDVYEMGGDESLGRMHQGAE
ncbi:acid protease [Hypoxylon cercidicola]|nr:acid protease [Hypoxylon cercidicola]